MKTAEIRNGEGTFQDLMRILRQFGRNGLSLLEKLISPELDPQERSQTLKLLRAIALSIISGEKESGQYYLFPLPPHEKTQLKFFFSSDPVGIKRIAKAPQNLTPDGLFHAEIDGVKVPQLFVVISPESGKPKAGIVLFARGRVFTVKIAPEEILEIVNKYL